MAVLCEGTGGVRGRHSCSEGALEEPHHPFLEEHTMVPGLGHLMFLPLSHTCWLLPGPLSDSATCSLFRFSSGESEK